MVQFVVVKVHAINSVFCCFYRPPDTQYREFEEALTELSTILSNLPTPTPTIIFGGDLNFPQKVIEWLHVEGSCIPHIGFHRGDGNGEGPKVRAQATKLLELMAQYNMAQYVNKVTHGKEIIDIMFPNDPDLVHSISTESFPSFTDHSLVNMRVNYKISKEPTEKRGFLLDSARRINVLDFNKAPWSNIRQELKNFDWSDLKILSSKNPVVAYSFFLVELISILEKFIPRKTVCPGRRNKRTRTRNLIWRKLSRLKIQMSRAISQKKM